MTGDMEEPLMRKLSSQPMMRKRSTRRSMTPTRSELDGSIFYEGDTSGSYSIVTHIKIFVTMCFVSCAGSLGVNVAYIQQSFKDAGAFSFLCESGQTCESQDAALSDFFGNTFAVCQMALLPILVAYDIYGVKRMSSACSFFTGVSYLGLALVLKFDTLFPGHTLPPAVQLPLLAVFTVFVQMQSAQWVFIGWQYHYPKIRTVIMSFALIAMFLNFTVVTYLIGFLSDKGMSAADAMLYLGILSLFAAIAIYFAAPTKDEYFAAAVKVLRYDHASMEAELSGSTNKFKKRLRAARVAMMQQPAQCGSIFLTFCGFQTFWQYWTATYPTAYAKIFVEADVATIMDASTMLASLCPGLVFIFAFFYSYKGPHYAYVLVTVTALGMAAISWISAFRVQLVMTAITFAASCMMSVITISSINKLMPPELYFTTIGIWYALAAIPLIVVLRIVSIVGATYLTMTSVMTVCIALAASAMCGIVMSDQYGLPKPRNLDDLDDVKSTRSRASIALHNQRELPDVRLALTTA